MLRCNPEQAPRLRRWSTGLMGVLAVLAVTASAGIGYLRSTAASPNRAQLKAEAQDKAKTDVQGDPLPLGARARMGTLRWRHGDTVTYVALTPDGKAVLTASLDKTIRLWERETGKEIRRFKGPSGPVQPVIQPGGRPWMGGNLGPVALSPDGKVLAASFQGLGILLWDVDTGKELRIIKAPIGIGALLFAPDGKTLVARGGNRITHLFETDTGREIRQIKVQPKQPMGGGVIINIGQGGASGMAISPDGKTLATAEMDFGQGKLSTYVRLSDMDTGKEIRVIDATPGGAVGLAFSPNGKILAYGSGTAILLRDVNTAQEIRQIKSPGNLTALVFAPDGKSLAGKGIDQVIRLWETDTAKELQQLGEALVMPGGNVVFFSPFAASVVQDFAFAPDGKVMLAGAGQTLRFWDVGTGKEQALSGGHRGPVSALVVSPDGKLLVSYGTDQVIRRWDAATGKELGRFAVPQGTQSVAFAPDGKTVAVSVTDTIHLYEVASGKELHQLKGHTNGTVSLAFSPNSKILASRGQLEIRLHDVSKGLELRQINLPVDKVAMNPGGFIALAAAQGTALAFSPDGQTVLAQLAGSPLQGIRPIGKPMPGQVPDTLRMWDVTTGKEIRKITLPQAGAKSVVYSPDGRVVATENADQTISLWEIASGKERARLGKPNLGGKPLTTTIVFSRLGQPTVASIVLAFSPDGGLLAAKGSDNAVVVWDVVGGKEIGQFKGHDGAIATVAFAPDGKSLASGSNDTTILVWEMAGLKREPTPPATDLQTKEVEALWADLKGDDAVKAFRGILRLATAPKQTVAFLREQLKPAVPVDPKKLAGMIAGLDSKNFNVRNKSTEELGSLGELAVPILQKLLASKPSLETQRRVETLLEKLTVGTLTTEQVRLVRAVEALERLDTPEARQVLETLAKGAQDALVTRQAQTALQRLVGK